MSLLKTTDIRIIGFDLDQTLYPKSFEIDLAIQAYIYEKISRKKGCSFERAKKLFLSYYPELSGSKTLIKLGFQEKKAGQIVQKALDKADITSFLEPDPMVVKLLKDIKRKYGSLSLITGSSKKLSLEKLKKLGIPQELFDFTIFGEHSKFEGSAYKEWFGHFKKKGLFSSARKFSLHWR